MDSKLIDRLEQRDDAHAADELARVLAAAVEDVGAGHGDDRPY